MAKDKVTFRVVTGPVDKPDENENIAAEETTHAIVDEEVPYTERTGKPFTAEYYELGDKWDVFTKEISTIEHYINRKIKDGEIANSEKAVQKEIKKMEKMHNITDEPRNVIKIGVISSYIDFLNEVDGIRFNWRRYGRS